MSNDLCSPFNCNICLMLKAHQQEEDQNYKAVNTSQSLLACSGCQLVKYCNAQHQQIDWPIHREFCRAVQKIKQNANISHPFYIAGVPQNRADIEKAIIQFKYLLRNALDRSLEYQEEELSSFPTFCGICFKLKKLKHVCVKCYSQAYCTEQHREMHREHHDKICDLLQIYYCPYKIQPMKKELYVQFNNRVKDLHQMNLEECVQKVFSLKLPPDPCQSVRNYQLFSWASDFSCIMTICYVIELLKYKMSNFEKFYIYILGASVEAILWFREVHCKLFFLQNPEIKELVLDFIGPDVVGPEYEKMKISVLGSERLVKFKIYKGLFQDYCKHYKIAPSLIVAFNCGFSEFSQYYNLSPNITSLNTLEPLDITGEKITDTWYEGLVEILQTFNTPIVFTSFTEQESQFDFAALQNAAITQRLKVHIERTFKAIKNPFHDLRPLRQWYTSDQEEFYYRNGYIQGICTNLEK